MLPQKDEVVRPQKVVMPPNIQMKKIILHTIVSLLMAVLSVAVQAQALVQPGKQWHVYTPGTCQCAYYTEILYVQGDTLIHDKTYSKLWRSDDSLRTVFLYRHLRQAEGKVWMYNAATQREHKLYDFSKAVGDTMHIVNAVCEDQQQVMKVLAVDALSYDGVAHRRLRLQNMLTAAEDIWVEGLGSLNGLVYPAYQSCSESSWSLWCMFQDKVLTYKAPHTTLCYSKYVGIAEEAHQLFELSPNPVPQGSLITVQWGATMPGARLVLYSITGQRLAVYPLRHDKQMSIPSAALQSGVYLLHLEYGAGARQVSKIIVL